MKNKDIREYIDDNHFFGEIRLWYDAQKDKNCAAVLVEAKQNEILFRKLLHKDCTFFPANGWAKIESALKTAKTHQIQNIIGIIDADFKRITDYVLLENLFLTDFHDTEIMLAHSEAWASMLNQYIDLEKLNRFETKNKTIILDFLLKTLKPLSVLRFLNEKYSLGLKFRTQNGNKYDYLKYKEFIETEKLSIDIDKMLKAVENKSSKPNFFRNNPKYQTELADFSQKEIDLKECTNGHDLANVLSIAFEKAISNKSSSQTVTGEEIEKTLNIAYRFSDFEQTNLHKTLENWQQKQPVFKLLK
ncbi:MAG: hypothetical protein RLZZ292_578 [Bacteroidota bacterium]|jgi:hypothetical protein